MTALRGVTMFCLSFVVIGCGGASVATPVTSPTPAIEATPAVSPSLPSASALASASASHAPIGLLPEDCGPAPDPVPVPVSDHVGEGIGGDPAWAIGFSREGTLSFTDSDQFAGHGWLMKVLWLLRRSTADPVTVAGPAVDGGRPLRFEYGEPGIQETTLVLDPAEPHGEYGDWFEYRGYFVVPTAGCYRLETTWPGGDWAVDFAAGLDPSIR